MEGFNGWARPLDSLVRQRGHRLYNINNPKLARFREIFPRAAKSDRIDAREGLELFQPKSRLRGQVWSLGSCAEKCLKIRNRSLYSLFVLEK
jgi:hypothetical protein